MTQFLWLIGVFAAALLGGLLGAGPVVFAPVVGSSLVVVVPLTILVAGVFCGVCAAWAGDWLEPEGVRRNLPRIVGRSETAAVVLAILLLALVFWLDSLGALSPSLFLIMLPATVVLLAIAASYFTWRYKAPDSTAGLDVLATLGSVGVMGFLVVWAMGLLSVLAQLGL